VVHSTFNLANITLWKLNLMRNGIEGVGFVLHILLCPIAKLSEHIVSESKEMVCMVEGLRFIVLFFFFFFFLGFGFWVLGFGFKRITKKQSST